MALLSDGRVPEPDPLGQDEAADPGSRQRL
jgi:hypothetical protein